MSKLFILGIDGAFPEYFFGDWLDDLPNIKRLISGGAYARLQSTIPPLSVTAWSSITTGKPPSDTGIFEYVYRKDNSYHNFGVVTSRNLKEKTIWHILSDKGKNSIVCNVLLTWPIKPFNGCMITGPLTPSGKDVELIYPRELKQELKDFFGEIPPVDVPNFRDLPEEDIAQAVTRHTENQIEIMKYLVKNKSWNLFFAMIPMSDRMNHTFWRYMDPGHRKYDPNSPLKNTLKNYYTFLDKKLGEFIALLDEDTKIIVLSDHGIMRMHSRVNLTDWLIQNEYMTLRKPLEGKKHFSFDMVDWKKTKVFAIGAYEAQIFINLNGREPEGIIDKSESDSLIDELIKKLAEIKGDDGAHLNTKFFRKKDYFKGKFEKEAPDLMIYFDDLQYGCNTTLIGNETLWSPQTAKGSDDAGHSQQGIFIMKDRKNKNRNLGEISYLDVAPTILHLIGIEIPKDMKGKVIR